ncbi:MAG TPA: ABC transporter permease [Vicinamibacterales bacterium]
MTSFFRAILDEYRRIFLDAGAVLVLVAALVLYAFFYPIPYLPEVLKHVPVVVVDLDQSELSRKLVRMIDAHELTHVAADARSLCEAEDIVRAGKADGVLVIPQQFERKVRRGDQAQVAAYADASYFLVYRQVLTGALEATGTLSAGIEIRRLQATGMPIDQAMKARDPLPLTMRPLFNPTEGYGTYIVPAVLVLILQQTLLVGIGLVGGTERERGGKHGRDARAARQDGVGRASGPSGSALSILLGKAVAYFALYLVHSLFYFGIVYKLFGFQQRADALTLLWFVTPFLLSVIFLGLTTRVLFRSREMALQVLLFTSLPALFLAGFSWPVEALPRWLATCADALPSTTGIAGFLRLTQMGAVLSDVRDEWLTLWVLCGAYFVLAWITQWWSLRAPIAWRRPLQGTD